MPCLRFMGSGLCNRSRLCPVILAEVLETATTAVCRTVTVRYCSAGLSFKLYVYTNYPARCSSTQCRQCVECWGIEVDDQEQDGLVHSPVSTLSKLQATVSPRYEIGTCRESHMVQLERPQNPQIPKIDTAGQSSSSRISSPVRCKAVWRQLGGYWTGNLH